MKRFPVRSTAAASAFFVATAFSGVGAATAAEPIGVGTSKATFSLVSLELGKAGSLLNLRVLADDALSTIDSLVAKPSAFSKLAPLSLTSSVLPVLNGITAGIPSFESRSDGNKKVDAAGVDFSQGASGLPALGALGSLGNLGGLTSVLGGQLIPTSLSSDLDDKGARSAIDSALANLSVLSGILNIKSVSNLLGTNAASASSGSDRGLKIDAISVLNLGNLLEGLGLGLADLPLGILNGLLKDLNLLGGLPLGGASDLTSAVSSITSVLDPLLKTVTGSSGIVGQVVSSVPVLSGLVPSLSGVPLLGTGGKVSAIPTDALLGGTVGSLLGTLQGTLSNLLGSALGSLGGLELLRLDGADVNVATKAAPALADSAANAVAQLGGLSVLGLKLPGVDLAGVGNLVNTVTGTLGGVLSIVDPALKDLLSLKLLNKVTDVVAVGGYNRALASFDVLSLDLKPLAGLTGIVGGILGAGQSSSPLALLGAAGVASPAASLPLIGGEMAGLNGLLNLGGLVGALTEGLSLKIGTMQSTSELATTAAAPAPNQPLPAPVVTELPRTGASTGTYAAMAALLAAISLGVRRWNRRPSLAD